MVMQRYYIKNKGEILQICLGVSLIILSIGLSIAIAKTDSLSLGHRENSLTLTKKAIKLENEAEKLEGLATKIKQKSRGSKDKTEAEKITSELEITRKEIGEIVDDDNLENKENGNI